MADRITVEELSVLCDTTVRLAEIKQQECNHLCVQAFAGECLSNLVVAYMYALDPPDVDYLPPAEDKS